MQGRVVFSSIPYRWAHVLNHWADELPTMTADAVENLQTNQAIQLLACKWTAKK